jgi:hypothetical protein
MFNNECKKELNIFSSDMNKSTPNLDEFLNSKTTTNKFKLEFNDPEKTQDEQEELDFSYIELQNKEKNKRKIKIMNKCSQFRFRRADKTKFALEESGGGSGEWILVERVYDEMKLLLENIRNHQLTLPTLVQNDENDFVLIATSNADTTTTTTTTTTANADTQTIGTVGGIFKKKTKKTKKTKKVRKHKAINQTGGNKGKLKKGYRFSGKKLKNGLPEIVKAKKI